MWGASQSTGDRATEATAACNGILSYIGSTVYGVMRGRGRIHQGAPQMDILDDR
jgi:hypothetical protein